MYMEDTPLHLEVSTHACTLVHFAFVYIVFFPATPLSFRWIRFLLLHISIATSTVDWQQSDCPCNEVDPPIPGAAHGLQQAHCVPLQGQQEVQVLR